MWNDKVVSRCTARDNSLCEAATSFFMLRLSTGNQGRDSTLIRRATASVITALTVPV